MGEDLLECFRSRVKKEYKLAFVTTFLIALLIHLYKFTNTLPNHDSVYNYYSDQNILGSGRWALSLACAASSYYDLPWVIGLLSCTVMALTVAVIVALFGIRNPVLIGLTGALLAASPATTETFFFLYTADGYMIAMLLAALSVYFSRIEETRRSRLVLSGICLCVSCGIYQAYVSFALLLAVCYFIDALMQNRADRQTCCAWVLRQVVIYIASLAVYYAIWKLCMRVSGISPTDYQGISKVGGLSARLLANGLIRSIQTVLIYFLQWDVFAHGWSLYSVLSVVFVCVLAIGLVMSIVRSGMFKRKWAMGFLLLCLLSIIPFAGIWHFTSDTVGYRAMMLQSLTLLFLLVALLYERWAKPAAKNAVCLFLLLVVANHALMANISYFYMNLCYERTYAESLEMIIRIHALQDEYEIDDIAVVGNRLAQANWPAFDEEEGKMLPAGKTLILSAMLETTLLINSDHVQAFLRANYDLELKSVSHERLEQICEFPQVQSMGCWPAGDSMAVIDGTLVIKLADEGE